MAARKPKQLSMHNDIREDSYYWLRDDDRKDPAVSVWLLVWSWRMAAIFSCRQTHCRLSIDQQDSKLMLLCCSCKRQDSNGVRVPGAVRDRIFDTIV